MKGRKEVAWKEFCFGKMTWLKRRTRVDEPVAQQEIWWWPGQRGQQGGKGERISRDLSVSPEGWQVDCAALVREREVSGTPLATGQMAVPIT